VSEGSLLGVGPRRGKSESCLMIYWKTPELGMLNLPDLTLQSALTFHWRQRCSTSASVATILGRYDRPHEGE
jgi:hypothetical protein